jgi:hypothetical protein
MAEPLVELARKRRAQDAPPWVVWEDLSDPFHKPLGGWFDLQSNEIAPVVVEGEKPGSLTWSSIWPDKPELRIRFEIGPHGEGSMVTLVLLGPEDGRDPDDEERRRYRLSQLINGRLRAKYG